MLFEQLLNDPYQRVVILRTVHLGDKRASSLEMLGGYPKRVKGDFVLFIRVFFVGRAHVWCTIAEHHVRLRVQFIGWFESVCCCKPSQRGFIYGGLVVVTAGV